MDTEKLDSKEAAKEIELIQSLQVQLEESRLNVEDLSLKLSDVSNAYDSSKQAELDQKNKVRHLERNLRALKNEKDELLAQIHDLHERVCLQAKDLAEAQSQRKLAVQEFTDVNEKVN